jgi:hypothetical protein
MCIWYGVQVEMFCGLLGFHSLMEYASHVQVNPIGEGREMVTSKSKKRFYMYK